MSTQNFYCSNVGNIYYIPINELFDIENYIEMAIQEGYSFDNERVSKGNSYGSTYFASKTSSICFGGDVINVNIRLKLNEGYYEGANFDYDILIDGFSFSDFDYFRDDYKNEIFEDLEYYFNKGIAVLHTDLIVKKIEALAKDMTDEAEKLFETWCEEKLRCVGVASNGEGFYERM